MGAMLRAFYRRNVRGGRRGMTGGVGGGRARSLIKPGMVGVNNFGANNFYITPGLGGEIGTPPFGVVELIQVNALTGSAGTLAGNRQTATGWDWQVTVNNGSIYFRAANASSAFVNSATYTILPSDVGKVLMLTAIHTGISLRLFVSRHEVGVPVAITGYTPNAAQPKSVGVAYAGSPTVPVSNITWLGELTFRGEPTVAQLELFYDYVRLKGEFPSTIDLVYPSANDSTIASTNPAHRYRFDTYVMSGANLASVPNVGFAGGQLNALGGALPEPVPTASLNGKKSLALNGSGYLQSSLGAAPFKFMHDGSPYDMFVVWESASSPGQTIISTSGGTGPGVFLRESSANVLAFQVLNDAAGFAVDSSTTMGTGATLYEVSYSEGSSPEYAIIDRSGTVRTSGASATNPGVGAPQGPLTVGARTTGATPSNAKIVDIIIYDRLLPVDEKERVRSALANLYNVGKASVTHRVMAKDAITGVTYDDALAPAVLSDSITNLAADALNKSGSLTVKVVSGDLDTSTLHGAAFTTGAGLASLNGEGLQGHVDGFWGAFLFRNELIGASTQWLVMSGFSGGFNWAISQHTPSSNLRLAIRTTGNVVLVSPVFALNTSDQGIIEPLVWNYDGSNFRLYRRGEMLLEITGAVFAASANPAAFTVGANAVTLNSPSRSPIFHVIGTDGQSLTTQQIAQIFSNWNDYGQFSAPTGVTAQHDWDITQDVNENGGVVNPFPLVVKDRIGTHHLSRIGGVEVVMRKPRRKNRVSSSTDGHRTYGVISSGVNVLATESNKGIRGSSAGFTIGADVNLSTTGLNVFLACSDQYENGWTLFVQSSQLRFVCTPATGAAVSVVASISSYTIPKRARVTGRHDGQTLTLWIDGVQLASVACVGFKPAAAGVSMSIGNRFPSVTASWTSDYTSVFSVTGGEYVATDGEIAAWSTNVERTGRMQAIRPGADNHAYDITQDVLENGGPDAGFPNQVKDRIGTDHMTKSGGLSVVNNGLTSFSVSGYPQSVSVASGLPGLVSGIWLESLVDAVTPSTIQALFSNTGAGATGIVLKIAANNVPYATLYNGSSAFNAFGGVFLNPGQRHHLAVTYDGSIAQFYVDGVASGTPTPSFVYAPGAQPVKLGTLYGGTSELLTNHVLRGVGGGNTVPTPSEIAAASAYALANGKLGSIAGKSLRLYSIVDDVIEAGGKVPAVIKDRVGGEHLSIIGTGLQLAHRVEQLMGWESAA